MGPTSTRSCQTRRNGYRYRPWTPGFGTIDVVAIPAAQEPNSSRAVVARRKRSENALITVVADCYLREYPRAAMDKLVKTPGITGLSKSQVHAAADLDEHVDEPAIALHDAGLHVRRRHA